MDAIFPHLLPELFDNMQSEKRNGGKFYVGISCWDVLGNDIVDLLSEDKSKSHSNHRSLFIIVN